MNAISLMLLPIISPDQQVFIPPIYKMSDIRSEISYIDEKEHFFLLVDKGKYYIGHPISEPDSPSDDTPYTWGVVKDCSTKTVTCVSLGEIYLSRYRILPNSRAGTNLFSWHRGFVAKASTAEFYGIGRNWYRGRSQVDAPDVTYYYGINANKVVTNIKIAFYDSNKGTVRTVNMKLMTRKGIVL